VNIVYPQQANFGNCFECGADIKRRDYYVYKPDTTDEERFCSQKCYAGEHPTGREAELRSPSERPQGYSCRYCDKTITDEDPLAASDAFGVVHFYCCDEHFDIYNSGHKSCRLSQIGQAHPVDSVQLNTNVLLDPRKSGSIYVGEIEFASDPVVAEHVKAIIRQLGLDPDLDDLRNTPDRVARMFCEFVRPRDLKAVLKDGFEDAAQGGLIVQLHIPFKSMCPHHLLPFIGEAAIGYIPNGRMVGLSKLSRLVDAVGTLKPSTQEGITNQIADALDEAMRPMGVAVVTEATHMCMASRGVNAPNTKTKVSAIRGVFMHSPQARAEFMALIKD
jgi:GTP cyclohydrolase IA